MQRRSPRLAKHEEYEINGYHVTVVADAADPKLYAQAHIRPLPGSAPVDAVMARAILEAMEARLAQ